MKKSQSFLIVIAIFCSQFVFASLYEFSEYVDAKKGECHWVEKPGYTEALSEVSVVNLQPGCKSDNGEKITALCSGVIRCHAEGMGDFYFENILCPGKVSLDGLKITCGSGPVNSCLSRNIDTGSETLKSYDGKDHLVVPLKTKRRITQ